MNFGDFCTFLLKFIKKFIIIDCVQILNRFFIITPKIP